jgi:hypothetical protein
VEVDGLVFRAEEAKGRRNRIGTVLITPPSSTARATPPTVEAPEVRA